MEKNRKLYFVDKYNRDNGKDCIISVLEKYTNFLDDQSSQNKHFDYLQDYFKKIDVNVETVVYEFDYIDKDYLEDYSRYYSKSFRSYNKRCIRLHFFKKYFDEEQFEDFITNFTTRKDVPEDVGNELSSNYLGFVVLRPLPFTLFGRTCLRTYSTAKNRSYPIVRKYITHLFGIELFIETLAYQEQDNAVSACATTALWSAFHGTGILFHHPIPSPYEITLNATEFITDYAKQTFPNEGLLPGQMSHAVKKQGLEPLMVDFINTSYLKAQVYAYLRCRIPIILGLSLEEKITKDSSSEKRKKRVDEFKTYGKHAVAITGYSTNNYQQETPFIRINFSKKRDLNEEKIEKKLFLRSSYIDQIFVHDDQIGPFAKMNFPEKEDVSLIKTKWKQYGNQKKEIYAKPTMLLIPLYHKIRIRFEKIFNIINAFTVEKLDASYKEDIVWDIYLTTVCDLKNYFRSLSITNGIITKESKLKLLSKSFPKYIWVADAYSKIGGLDDKLSFSFYFDATDMNNSDLFICALHYDDKYTQAIMDSAHNYRALNGKKTGFDPEFRETFHSQKILNCYLDDFTDNNLVNNNEMSDDKVEQKIFYSPVLLNKIGEEFKSNDLLEKLEETLDEIDIQEIADRLLGNSYTFN